MQEVAGSSPAEATIKSNLCSAVVVLGIGDREVETIAPAALEAALGRGEAVVLDLDTSRRYREGHVPGAWFAVRSRLAAGIRKAPRAEKFPRAHRHISSLDRPFAVRLPRSGKRQRPVRPPGTS